MVMETFLPFLTHKNSNGRIYNKESFENVNISKFNGSYGMLMDDNHEDEDTVLFQRTHIIKNIEMNDKGIFGDIEILSSQRGTYVKKLIESGVEFIVRPSLFGTIENDNGMVYVQSIRSFDLSLKELDTFDPDLFNKRFNFIDR